jgi:tetratricopeptide (TPR) repeat protein
MIDSLDLQELQERGEKYKKEAQSKRRPAIIMIVIVLLVMAYVQWNYTPAGAFYWQNGQSWDMPQTDRAFWKLEYSDSGILWAVDWEFSNLHRYSDGKWTQIEQRTLGTNHDDIQAFTVNGEEVWAVVEADIAHFDGQRWIAYNDVLSLDNVAGIAAGDYGVVIADREQNLITFDGTDWYHNQFVDVLPDYAYGEDNYTSLIGDADGVWLSAGGLWNYNPDGQDWELVTYYPARDIRYTYLSGMDEHFVYLASYGRLLTVKKSSYEMVYSDVDAGFPEDADYLLHAERHNDLLWVSVDNQLYTFDGHIWSVADSQLPPMHPSYAIWDFAFAPDGSIVLGTLNPDAFDKTFVQAFQPVFLLCGAPVLLAMIMMYFTTVQSKQTTERAALVRKRLPTLLPDMPEYVPLNNAEAAKKTGRNWFFAVLLIVAVVIAPTIVVITGGSGFQAMLLVAGLIILYITFPMLRRLFDRENNPANRAYLLRNIITISVIFGTSIMAMWLIMDLIFPFIIGSQLPLAIESLILYGGTVLVFMVSVSAWTLLPSMYMLHPLKHGDYDTALKRAENLRKLMPKYLSFMIQHCFVLVVRGDYEAAKALYREILTEAQNGGPDLVAPMLCNYAIALRETGQTDEALQMLEAATKILPDSVSGYRSLAEFYFVLGQFPSRAFELTDVMMQFTKKPRFNLFLRRYDWGYTLGVRAVTLANVGRFEEADVVIAQALAETDQKYRPGLALLHLYEAFIAKAKNDLGALQRAVQKALDADAQSAAAKIAQRLLDESGKVA